jgi:glutamyl-tRNA reductase
MRIFIAGLNHHAAPVDIREKVAVPSLEKASLCSALFDAGAAEAVVISTCNRTELVAAAENVDAVRPLMRNLLLDRAAERRGDVESLLFELEESDAVRHLFEVATSLDSLVIGEPHIIGQIREDADRAQKAGTVGKILSRLFSRASFLAKSVRQYTALGCNPVSVSSIALDLATKVFGSIAEKRVLILGAGEMGRQTAILASHRGAKITVASRTITRAEEIAERVEGTVLPWDERMAALAAADIVVTSTGATSFVLTREDMTRVMHERRGRQLFIIDIAMPRDVDPSVDDLYNLYRYDLDDLTHAAEENAARRKSEIPKVRIMIEDALIEFEKWRTECTAVQDIVMFRDKVEQIRKTEVDTYLKKMSALNERDKNLIEAMSQAVVNKILHLPTVRLKEAAADGTSRRHADSLRYLFGLSSEETQQEDDEE